MEKIQYQVVTLAGESVFGFHNHIFHHPDSSTLEMVSVFPNIGEKDTKIVRQYIGFISNCNTDITKLLF